MSKLKFFAPKHKMTGRYNGMLIAEDKEMAKEIAIKNEVIKAYELDDYEFEDVTQKMSDRDKWINNIQD